MKTHLVFRNAALVDEDASDSNPSGKKLATLLGGALPAHGFHVRRVLQEDWGWVVMIENPAFSLWVGCGQYPDLEDGHLCFIEPSKPQVRRWLKRVDTTVVIGRLATALEAIVRAEQDSAEVRWWSEDEVRLR